uniref:Uncharacterized protein n=1 Tax=Lepeophtheirus salmonis TaxID=72036 RepID=A0A0K2UCQ9_LEPSM
MLFFNVLPGMSRKDTHTPISETLLSSVVVLNLFYTKA